MDVFEAISTNLAVREFQDKPIGDEQVSRILEAGRLCQSGKNLQPWHFIVIRDRVVLNKLGEMMLGDMDEPLVKKAPLAIGLVSDPKSEFDKIDVGRAAQNITLAAWELGIGSCFMSGPEPPNRESYRKEAHDYLNIPPSLNLIDLIIFGYPKRRRMAKHKKRKELTQLISLNKFGRPLTLKSCKPCAYNST